MNKDNAITPRPVGHPAKKKAVIKKTTAEMHQEAVGVTGKLWGRTEVKIAELDGTRKLRADTENVLGFDVPVGNPEAVQVLDGRGEIVCDLCGLFLSQTTSSIKVGEQGPSKHLFKDKVEEVGLFKELNKLNDGFLSATQVIKLNLPQNLYPVESTRGLPDDLDSKLLPSEDVYTGFHLAVVALAEQLSRQAVLVGEGGAETSPRRSLLLPPPQLLTLCKTVFAVLKAALHILL